KGKSSTKVAIAIVIPVVVLIAALVASGLCFAKKRAKRFNDLAVGSGEDFATLESLQHDLVTLQSATNNFSEENKLGEGGFGGVYKAWKLWNDGKPLEFVDPIIRDSCSSNEVLRCIHLGLLCVQDNADDRPTIATALLMLDIDSVNPPVPKEPAYYIRATTTSFGNDTNDVVYGLFLCRGDQNATGCGDCVTTAATADLPNVYCPGAMGAVICESDVGRERSRFIDAMYNTLNSMVADTASNTSGKKFTTKAVNVTSSITLYALAQCTPDLSPNDCKRCLTECIGKLDIMTSSQTLMPSCFVRYESFPFFIGAVNYSSSTPQVFGSKGRKKVSAGAIIGIVFSVVALSAVILALGICFVKKRYKKFGAIPIQNGEDFTTLDSLQYDLATLQLATNNFSEESKIAEGGFGGVYKVR
uniref:Gnk2-homologous domain-containing protein n=1 Tax=Chenopodium quinoa TaxID=63459 RepID=A0A803M250_CHEQI